MFEKEENHGAAVLVSFLIGGIIGAGLAILFAPQSGQKTRKKIADMAEDVRDQASVYAKQVKAKIS